MRFVLVSTHTDQTTGYSKVSQNLLKQLATLSPKVKTYHFGFQRHPVRGSLRGPIEGVVQYDAAANEDPKEEGFGFNKINEYLEMVNPDVVMIYNDPLIIYRFIEAMKYEKGKSPYKLWVYVDQVYEGIAPPLVQKIQAQADRIFCFTPSWKTKFLQYGPTPAPVDILGHAIDASVFTMLPAEARKQIRTNMNIPQDAVIFLNANRNSQRKRLDATIAGFVRLLKRNPDAPYYLILATTLNPQAGAYYDCQRIFVNELQLAGLNPMTYGQRVMMIDTAPPNTLTDDAINQLYNVSDIGINTSDGEGFGLCQLEHMYTGAPQIVTDIGAYRDFLDETVAEFVKVGDPVYFPGSMPLGFYSPAVSSDEVASAMDRMVKSLPEHRKGVASYPFKSWASICDEFLEQVLKEASTGYPGASGSASAQ